MTLGLICALAIAQSFLMAATYYVLLRFGIGVDNSYTNPDRSGAFLLSFFWPLAWVIIPTCIIGHLMPKERQKP